MQKDKSVSEMAQYRMCWPKDLEEITPLRLGGACCTVVTLQVNSGSYSPECVEGSYYELRLNGFLRSWGIIKDRGLVAPVLGRGTT